MAFADTSILLHAVSRDPAEQAKATRALAILDAGNIEPSPQVLQEFYVQVTRPTRPARPTHEQGAGLIEPWLLVVDPFRPDRE